MKLHNGLKSSWEAVIGWTKYVWQLLSSGTLIQEDFITCTRSHFEMQP